jgi:phospholipase/lecithinase/hemolysin
MTIYFILILILIKNKFSLFLYFFQNNNCFGFVPFWQRLYNNGARKFEIIGVSTIGCVPALRLKNKTECFSEANFLSIKYNEGLQSMLKELKLENKYLSYSYFDTYGALQDLIQNPISYGMMIT